MREAFKSRLTSDGLFVARFHYAADSSKDPTTEEGRQWLERALVGYPGGIDGPKWQKEMEINALAAASGKAIPKFTEWCTHGKILCDPFPEIAGATLYGSYDHGYSNPAAYLVHGIWPDGMRRTIWECYGAEIHPNAMSKVIRGETVTLSDGRILDGNPYAGKEIIKIADPAIDRRDAQQSTGETKRTIELFRENKVYFVKGERGNDLTFLEDLLGTLWFDPLNPGYQITRNCKNYISELRGLEHPEVSDLMALQKNKPEGIKDKNNHAWDSAKYFFMQFPVTPNPKETAKTEGGTWEWHKKMAQAKRAPKYVTYSFQRSTVR